ncbi:hypothetical protein E6C27_scaffold49482G00020 [Cucumis melo var. makuwa]|uniref:Uncharacterized protein n=1 Tax=Cucumis melo var. makuwa TaxID=1194695 RepID=A0A5A7V9S8_CUCMM|nr:hypothetical protein E6C27_scaffold49482G00020 [Cucumis melo var. makuwa]
MEGQRPLLSPPVKNWGLTITSQYAFLSCLSSFMVRYSGVLGVEEAHQSIPKVVKLYCGDDTVGEVLRKNSSTPVFEPLFFNLIFTLYSLRCAPNKG